MALELFADTSGFYARNRSRGSKPPDSLQHPISNKEYPMTKCERTENVKSFGPLFDFLALFPWTLELPLRCCQNTGSPSAECWLLDIEISQDLIWP
jgi:hypothetical protein